MRKLEIVGRGPRSEEEERVPLMTLDALLLAVECLREHGSEREHAEAARLLDRKAMKLRARQAMTAHFEEHCFCGNERPPGKLLCRTCHTAIPMSYLLAWHYGPQGKASAALGEIRDWCRLRNARRAA